MGRDALISGKLYHACSALVEAQNINGPNPEWKAQIQAVRDALPDEERVRFEQFVAAGVMDLHDDKYNAIGLCGEAGEVAEWVKKMVCRTSKADFTEEDLLLELGDVLHYATRFALGHGWTLEDIMAANMAKLAARRAK